MKRINNFPENLRKILNENARIHILKFSYNKEKRGNPFEVDLTVDYDLALDKIIEMLKEHGVSVELFD